MDLQAVLARLRGDGDELLKKALRCSSADELMELAGEHGIDLGNQKPWTSWLSYSTALRN